jgi:hypothetical protein
VPLPLWALEVGNSLCKSVRGTDGSFYQGGSSSLFPFLLFPYSFGSESDRLRWAEMVQGCALQLLHVRYSLSNSLDLPCLTFPSLPSWPSLPSSSYSRGLRVQTSEGIDWPWCVWIRGCRWCRWCSFRCVGMGRWAVL